MRTFLKNMSHLALGPKGGAGRAKKSPKRPGLWNPVPAIINPSWVAKLDHCLKPTAVGDLRRLIFCPTPPRLSPGRYTSFNLPEIELIHVRLKY